MTTLTGAVMANVAAVGTWVLGEDMLGAPRTPYRSSLYTVTPAVYRADASNNRRDDLTPSLLSGTVDLDIDRAGPKGQLDLTVYDAARINAWDWIAPSMTVTPEVGDPVTAQLGLYRLDQPRTEAAGDGSRSAQATGLDIISLLDRQVLTAPLTIPPGVNVMRVVRMVTELAGAPVQAPNLVANPDFAQGITGWTASYLTGMPGQWFIPDNTQDYAGHGAASFSASGATALDAYALLSQATARPLVPGTQRVRLGFWTYDFVGTSRVVPRVEFLDAGGAVLAGINGPDAPIVAGEWVPATMTAAVPAGAVTVRPQVRIYPKTLNATPHVWVDAFWLGEDRPGGLTRHAYPDVDRRTTAYTSYPAGTKLLTIVNDLLASVGHYAAYATPDGRPTSRPYRDLAHDTPARTWTVGVDSQIVGTLAVERATGNLYNVVVLVKEDYQSKTSLQGVARNDDPNHPWSTVAIGEIAYQGQAMVPQEADQAALDAMAADILTRASETESLALTVLPDPALSIYDVVAVTGANGPEDGAWALEHIAWNLDPSNPVVTVGARRTLGGGT